MLSLIIGGSGSGKSEYAENQVLCSGDKKRIYIATMIPFDKESELKIKRHRHMRENKNFCTIECYTNLEQVKIPKNSIVLLECISNLTANELYQKEGAGNYTVENIIKGIKKIRNQADTFIVVSNDVFSDGITYDESTNQYLSYLGEINRQIGELADEVVEIVYSIPIFHKKQGV